MNFDPQKFCIGLMDFFSILLLGALLTLLLMGEMGPVILAKHEQPITDTICHDQTASSWHRIPARPAGPKEKFAGERTAPIVEYMNRHDVQLADKGGYP
jgi:hypothetical protein